VSPRALLAQQPRTATATAWQLTNVRHTWPATAQAKLLLLLFVLLLMLLLPE
jgi:hypothetical protein